MDLRIEGLMTTASPLHISAPEKNLRYDPGTGRFLRGAHGGFPCTATRTQRARSLFAATETNPLGILRLPVIPAQGLRGRLRRLAAADVEDALIAHQGEKVPFAVYQAMHSGAVTGNPDGGAPPLDVAKSRRDHFFAGLWGGGTQMVPGRLSVTGGRMVCEPLLELGAIPERYRDEDLVPVGSVHQVFEALPVVRKDDALQFSDPRAMEVIDSYDQAMLDALGDQAGRRARKARAGAEDAPAPDAPEEKETRGLQAFSYTETVVCGIPFYARFDLRSGTPAQAGALLTALGRLLAPGERHLGGRSAVGFGEFAFDFSALVDGQRVQGVFAADAEGGTALSSEHPSIAACLEAYERSLEQTSVGDLATLLTQGA